MDTPVAPPSPGAPASFEVEFFDALGQGVVMAPEELQQFMEYNQAQDNSTVATDKFVPLPGTPAAKLA